MYKRNGLCESVAPSIDIFWANEEVQSTGIITFFDQEIKIFQLDILYYIMI